MNSIESFNDFITLEYNSCSVRRTKKTLKFLQKAYNINTKNQMPFDYGDFPELTPNNFRQYIHKLRPLIEVVIPSHPSMYKLKGIRLPGEQEKITQKVTGDDFTVLLEQLRHQPPSLHDIKVMTKTSLHKSLVDLGAPQNKNNKGIRIDIPSRDGFVFKAMVYPNTLQVDIGCTFNPLAYDVRGVLRLISKLDYVKYVIEFYSNFTTRLPEVMDWIITHYHFAKDGVTYDGEKFHYTVEDAAFGLIRCYVKTMKDGTQIPRLEQVRTPSRTIGEELEHILEASENV